MFARRRRSSDYPWAPSDADRAATIEQVERDWVTEDLVRPLVPSRSDDPAFLAQLARYFRRSASPGAAAQLLRMNTEIDVRAILQTIRVPTLVLHRTDDRDALVEEGRWIAARIPGASFIELPGGDHLFWVGDSDAVLAEIEAFLTGVPSAGSRPRAGHRLVHRCGRVHRVGRASRRPPLARGIGGSSGRGPRCPGALAR